jgi:hypothetical protein
LHATATRKLEHAMADDKSKDKTLVEYKTGAAFPGRMGRTIGESSPAWPAPVRAKPGAPNVLFIVLDDVGFAQLGCYGSPINTPNIDKLAHNGLLYTNMHTTALCSPSRSCFLTGRNHHSNGMSCITEGAVGFPGSDPPPVWWTPMLGFRAERKVSDEPNAPGISGNIQTRSGRPCRQQRSVGC